MESQNRLSSPDGGWGWCVVLASFLSHVIQGGFMYTVGILYHDIGDYFGANRRTVGMMASMTLAVAYGTSAINGVFVSRWGCRPVGAVGGLMCALGLIITSLAPSIGYIFLSCGLLTAWGIGLMFLSAVVIVQEYFDRRRSFAAGLSLCGAGLGTLAFAPLLEVLQEQYGWRGAVAILGAVFLNGFAYALVYRPLHLNARVVSHILHAKASEVTEKRIAGCDHNAVLKEAGDQTVLNSEDVMDAETRRVLAKGDLSTPGDAQASTSGRLFLSVKQGLLVCSKKPVLILCVGAFLEGLGMPTIMIFLPDLAVKEGVSPSDAAFLFSLMGVAITAGRLVLGWLSDKPFVNKPIASSVTIVTMGVVTALCPVCVHHYVLLACLSTTCGICYGYRAAILPVVLRDLISLKLLAPALGMVYIWASVGYLLGPPMTGLMYDRSGAYTVPFVVTGELCC